MKNKSILAMLMALCFLGLGFWIWFNNPGSGQQQLNESNQSFGQQADDEASQLNQTTALQGSDAPKTGDQTNQDSKHSEERFIFGTVSMADGGHAVEDAMVYVVADGISTEWHQKVLTGNQGEFKLPLEDVRTGQIFAMKKDLVSWEKKEATARFKFSEQDMQIGPVHLKLYPAAMLKMRVVSQTTGALLAGATAKTIFPPEYRFEDRQDGILEMPLSPEKWALQVAAPGYQMKLVNLDLSDGFKDEIEVALEPGGKIFGEVRDLHGDLVSDARIWAEALGMRSSAISGLDGEFVLDHLPLDLEIRISGRKKGVGNAFVRINLSHRKEVELNLELGSTRILRESEEEVELEGWVTDEVNEPLEGVTIKFEPYADGLLTRATQTDTAGFFRLKVAKVGHSRNKLVLTKKGYATQFIPFQTKAGDKAQLKIVLRKGHSLEGVVMSKDGQVIPKASIKVEFLDLLYVPKPIRTHANQDGVFILEDLPSKIHLQIRAKGFTAKKFENVEMGRKDVPFVLEGKGIIEGRVVYKGSGQPVPSFKIIAQQANKKHYGSYGSETKLLELGVTIENLKGEFQLEGLESSQSYHVFVLADGYALEKAAEIVARPMGETEPLVLELEPQDKSISGVVVNSYEQGLDGVFVVLAGALDQVVPGRLNFPRVIYRETQTTDSSGRFIFENIPEDLDLMITGNKEGYASADLLPHELKDEVSLTLYKEAEIQVKVHLKKRTPDDRISLSQGAGASIFRWMPSSSSEVDFPNLTPGEYRISFFSEDRKLRKRVTLEEGETAEVLFEDEGNRKLSGIAMIDGQPAGARQLYLNKNLRSSNLLMFGGRTVSTDDVGRFEFEDVPPQAYDLVLLPRQGRWEKRGSTMFVMGSGNNIRVTVDEEDIDQTFSFEKHSLVKGVIKSRKSIGSLILSKHPSQIERFPYQAALTPDNRFQFLDIEPGVYSLHVLDQQPVRTRLILRDILIPDDGSSVDLGEVDAEPNGSLKLIMQSSWMPEGLNQLEFLIAAKAEDAQGGSPMVGSYLWENLSQPWRLENLTEGQYYLALKSHSGGFTFHPHLPQFDIEEGLTNELTLALKPTTFIAVKMPIATIDTKASMVHGDTGEEVVFERVGGDREFFLTAGNEKYAMLTVNQIVAAGWRRGVWLLKIDLGGGDTRQHEVVLEPGQPLLLELNKLRKAGLQKAQWEPQKHSNQGKNTRHER